MSQPTHYVTSDQENAVKKAFFGTIYTSNKNQLHAEAIIVEGDTITFVGSRNEAMKQVTPETQVYELEKDSLLLPGFIDTHAHPIIGALRDFGCVLEGCHDFKDLKERITSYIQENPNKDWIICHHFENSQFPNSKPHRKYLDEICSSKPMILNRFNIHGVLCNSKALEVCGITKDSTIPPPEETMKHKDHELSGLWHEENKGVIQKDENGELTGVLIDAALHLIKPFLPTDHLKDIDQAFKSASDILLSEGITTYIDACVKPYLFHGYDQAYRLRGDVIPRVSLCVAWSKKFEDALVNDNDLTLRELTEIKENPKLRVNSIKFFMDGIMGDETALICSHYCCGGHSGLKMYEDDRINNSVANLHKRGIQCHFHAIGDMAVKMSLNAVEHAWKMTPNIESPRHFISHNQLICKEDIKRYHDLKVAANYTPVWFADPPCHNIRDVPMVENPTKDLLESGALLIYGSDWPITSLRPIDGIEAIMTRRPIGADPKKVKGMFEEQCLDISEAIKGYTISGAYTAGVEKIAGSLEVGKKADIVILDQNIFNMEKHKVNEAKVDVTIVGGKIVYVNDKK